MALKALMLRRSIDTRKKDLEVLRAKDAEFTTRETELKAAIAEAETQEQQDAVAQEVETFEQEKTAHETAKSDLENEINNLERELADEEAKAPAPKAQEGNTRKEEKAMNTRVKFFGMSLQEGDQFIQNDEVKKFLQRFRELRQQSRAVTGAELNIPTLVLDLMRENVGEYSKLYKYLRVRKIKGKARQNVMGAVPEAIWMEMTGPERAGYLLRQCRNGRLQGGRLHCDPQLHYGGLRRCPGYRDHHRPAAGHRPGPG